MQETNQEVKLCKDCKFFCPKIFSDDLCLKDVLDINPVDGTKHYLTCYEVRRIPWKCYRDGKSFEPKETTAQLEHSVIKFIKQIFKGK